MENRANFNNTVQTAYFEIIGQAKQLISSLEEEALRGVLERQEEPNKTRGYIVHELINPLIYARLEAYKDDILGIHYGYEQSEIYTKYYPLTSAFIRSIYSLTAKENTAVDIEDCIRTDWVITNCAELYDYMMERNKLHIQNTLNYAITAK